MNQDSSPPDQLPRRLAAILYADVVGYSRLSGEDEDATHRQLTALMDIVESVVTKHRGSVTNTAGDAVLARFDAAVDALVAAVAIQEQLPGIADSQSASRHIQLRIGVNLGDIIEDRGDIYGDGVNVAARLEALAEPGGVCVSEAVFTAAGNRLPLAFQDIGEQQVKNINRPIRAYRVVVGDTGQSAPPEPGGNRQRRLSRVIGGLVALAIVAGVVGYWRVTSTGPVETGSVVIEEQAATPPADRPEASIAVLPFTNLGGDADEDYYTDGITNDIITDLSRLSGLFVIASNTVFTYKGTAVKIQDVASELGVNYVLEGSIQRAGDRVRINAQLIDARSEHHLWAERFDRELTDTFALQDEVSQKIVSALAVQLTPNEADRLAQSPVTNPEAYDLLLRGLELFRRFTRETNQQAQDYFRRAIAVEPEFARAYADLALAMSIDIQFGWVQPGEAVVEEILTLGHRALELNPGVRQVHFALCSVYTVLKEHDKAIAAGREAVRIDPNYADGYANLAQALNYAGQPREALDAMAHATRLNPRYAFFYTYIIGQSEMFLERYDEAIDRFNEVVERNAFFPGAHLSLAAIYGNLGQREEAEWQAVEIMALQPDFSLARERAQIPIRRTDHLEWYIGGLEKAGLPD